jgi:lipoprotein-anchoring transpeptidase ErfK/SrfK
VTAGATGAIPGKHHERDATGPGQACGRRGREKSPPPDHGLTMATAVRSSSTTLRPTLIAVAAIASVIAPSALAWARPPTSYPAAGTLVQPAVAVHSRPSRNSTIVRTLHQFRADSYPQEILALRSHQGPDRLLWYRLSLPGRPNGQRGWVRADLVDVEPVEKRIVVHLTARRLDVRQLTNGKLLLSATIAVGKPSARTPLGRDYYVQGRFVPVDRFYGTFALETSAYSRLTDWPGGGAVGIHDTSLPQLIGQAVSHGCIRLDNRDADKLKRLAPLGTPIDIFP